MKITLPKTFELRMKELLGGEFEEYLSCFADKNIGGLRVNTLKLTPKKFETISPFALERIAWIKNGYYCEGEEKPSKHPYYYAGLYYLQEPSAMTPASLLPVKPGDRVLDLCAAPGGKSTELAAKLQGEGVLVANDISNSRAKALLKNMELFGVRNAAVISESPAKLAGSFQGYFNRILVDAPCSGEGMFRKSPAIMKNWEQYGVEYYHDLQLEILPHAVSMLAPGGYLLYSTCTFSPEEDEQTVAWLLKTYPELSAVPLPTEEALADGDLSFAGFDHGHPEWVEPDGLSETEQRENPDVVQLKETQRETETLAAKEAVKNALRIWPHKVRGEGHFVALFKKAGEEITPEIPVKPAKKKLLTEEAEQFLNTLKISLPKERLTVRADRVYLLPEGLPCLDGLRILRSGLFLGEMKKNRFEPSQALACALRMEEYHNTLNLLESDERVLRYLKCESIDAPEAADGWCLVCVDGYPLGWGKVSKGNLKNKYLPGWRYL